MNLRTLLRSLLAAIILCAFACSAWADEVQVAVAANFTEPMKKIAAGFEASTGNKVTLAFGSTGSFYSQIKAGAPFEVLVAADDATPVRLEQEGAAVKGSHFTYAIGKLVLWSANESAVDDNGQVLAKGTFDHIAVANPKLAPYGAAGIETLKALGLYEALSPKIVQAENIAQTYQFIATGNALLGFVALSQVIGENGKVKTGSFWMVPQKDYMPIRQDAVLLEQGRDKAAAIALLKYLGSDPAKAVIASYGYGRDN